MPNLLQMAGLKPDYSPSSLPYTIENYHRTQTQHNNNNLLPIRIYHPRKFLHHNNNNNLLPTNTNLSPQKISSPQQQQQQQVTGVSPIAPNYSRSSVPP